VREYDWDPVFLTEEPPFDCRTEGGAGKEGGPGVSDGLSSRKYSKEGQNLTLMMKISNQGDKDLTRVLG